MKIRSDNHYAFRATACAAIASMVLAIGCAARISQPSPLDSRAETFLRSRSQPAALNVPEPTARDVRVETVEVTGAVAQPGTMALEPALQTLREALDAAGGVAPTADRLRIRPGDDALAKLFALDGGPESVVEIPLSALGETTVYLRAGDVIEAATVEAAQAKPAVEAPAATTAEPALVQNPPATKPVSPPPVAASQPSTAGLFAPPANVAPGSSSADEGASLRADFARLRAELEGKLAGVRVELERLQQENARLGARLERSAAASSVPPALSKPLVAKSSSPSASSPAKTAAAPKVEEPEEKPPVSTRPATVLVSGSVRRPGAYAIDQVKTVRGAVRAAGDRTDANLEAVEVRPEGQRGALAGMGLGLGAQPGKTVVNLVAVESGKGSDVPLRGGEVIFVPPSSRSEQRR